MKYQRGYINIPAGVFETLFLLAAVGSVSLLFGAGYFIYWLVQHVRFV